MKKWFDIKSANSINNILEEIKAIKNKRYRNFYLLALANIIKDVSKVDSRCVNHLIIDKNKAQVDIFKKYLDSLVNLKEMLIKIKQRKTHSKAKIIIGDAQNLGFISKDSIDLIISHPPYFGQIMYYNIYSLADDIIGSDYDNIKSNDLSTNNLNKYINGMKKVFDEMYRVLKPNKYMCVIVGDSRKDGQIIPISTQFIDYATKIGFKLTDIFIWILGGKAGMNVARRGNFIDHNYILVFKK